MLNQVRVRFAPSPTGKIHLGGLRTALYNYLFARQNNGSFILRIEDTDQSRLQPGSAEEIESTLNWFKLNPDESPTIGGPFKPYRQSERLNYYRDYAQELLDSGKAYRCFCSKERLELLRKYQSRNREKPHYDGKCKQLSGGEIKEKLASHDNEYVIRFSLQPNETSFDDLIFGKITNNLIEIKEGDPIIVKSDKFPTYHFANVVDDHLMKISHVLRGSEWITSTTKHVQLYQAFNWHTPNFLHFPLVALSDGSKMSKRNNNSHVETWIKDGYRPLAMINFLTSMGGGLPKEKQDSFQVWSIDDLIANFDFNSVSCHPSTVDIDRLNRYNSIDIQNTWISNSGIVLQEFKEKLQASNVQLDLDDDKLKLIIGQFVNGRINSLNDLLTEDQMYIWRHLRLTLDFQIYLDKGWNLQALLSGLKAHILEVDLEDESQIVDKMNQLAIDLNIQKSQLFMFVRKLITGNDKGLPVRDILRCLGKDRVVSYLDEVMERLN